MRGVPARTAAVQLRRSKVLFSVSPRQREDLRAAAESQAGAIWPGDEADAQDLFTERQVCL